MDTRPPLFASCDAITLDDVLDSIGDAVCMTDRNLRFVAANRLFAAFYRLSDPRDLINRTAFEVYPEFRQSVFYEACQRTIDTGETVSRFGYSANLQNWVLIRCYQSHQGACPAEDRYVMVVHRMTNGTSKADYSTAVDALTSLPNRLAFEQEAQVLRSTGQDPIILTLLDISHFKHLNSTLGFEAGDRILMTVAARLKRAALVTDRVYRVGNDQFLIMGGGDASTLDLRQQRVMEALAQPLPTPEGVEYLLQFHGGTHMSHDPETPADGMAKAERALAVAKEQRQAVVHYTAAMGLSTYDPRLTKDIHDAINSGQLELFYQPQVDALDGKVLGSEALVRWRHPERGLVAPQAFLPFAEETGLIEAIDRKVVELAFEQVARWQAQGRPWPLSINLSAQSLCNATTLDHVQSMLNTHKVDPTLITFEITETSLMHDAETSQRVIESLKQLGFEIGIDDFGTGYASMAYLARYPAHTLKIDRSFVQQMAEDPTQRTMVRNMILLARSLGIKVVAEGVETAVQADLLRRDGCDVMQGYLYAAPLTLEQFEAWTDGVGWTTLGSDLR